MTAERTTDSGIPVQPVYRAADLGNSLNERLGEPGQPPFTRGPYPAMYRERPWTMRQYAGYGSADDTNARYRFLLDQGQTALSVAFDLPTQLGLDSSDPDAAAEVGRVGVAIDTADDMAAVFDGLPLDRLSVNFTINATAPIILAFYLVAAERQGVARADLSGTLQNDILKEFLARKTFIFPPAPSLRLVGDVVEFCTAELPRFNPISITGYHAREAGCDAVQEVAFTLADAIAYCDDFVGRGMTFDDFAPRLSFHFATTLDLFEEVAKLRAARRMWATIARDRFGAQRPEAMRLRFFSGCSGATLTAQQPMNNVVRSTIQCLGAVLGGAQSIHVMGYDEALAIPSDDAVTLALRTQQIVAHESGVTNTVDPLAGSFYVESLTDEIERRAGNLIADIDAAGGAVAAIEAGEPQRLIATSAFETERAIADGTTVKVGVNRFADDDNQADLDLFELDESGYQRQLQRLETHLAGRDDTAVAAAIDGVRRAAADGSNLMGHFIDAARAGATIGEIATTLRDEFGEYEEPAPW
ncbi:MAG: methylmalonyl-CoA mutase family protein [Ilumatobacteraceae bacterium]|uniref:acyl-CoA mutase large subunit family protein n=1 Tax=Ilumatobacter fluminis TaxID=467091 RepID=UPI002969F2AC|nr:methylmalonyl-CoA mutase family protein [Ilumatobacteraceae bacterium]